MARKRIEEKIESMDCVLYARVSSKEQEREGYSIDAQVRLLRDYAERTGLKILDEYIDIESAKASGRQHFSRMLEFFKQDSKLKDESHRCRILLVEKTDRLYRNIKDWTTMDDYDLQIHLVKEGEILGKDSKSQSKFMHGIRVLMAKNYTDNLSEEVMKGMIEKAHKGVYPGKAPLGYMNVECDGRKLIQVDPYYGPIIKRLFERYSTGNFSLKDITTFIHEEGLVYRKSGAKVHRSVLYTTLTNPIYYGDFIFSGTQYKGSHDPLISRDLFDQVQSVLLMKGKHRTKIQKHNWAFQGLIRCGHCDSALTAEIKKKKYVYYHCTGSKGRCPEQKYVREEEIARQYGELLGQIKIDKDVLDWLLAALKESHGDKVKYHEEMIAKLHDQYKRLGERVDAMYLDKLDGRITSEFFDSKSGEWRNEQDKILRQIEAHKKADQSYMEKGIQLLELAQRSVILYEKQEMREKRKILNFVVSNSIWKDGKLSVNFRKPFDLLAVTKQKSQEIRLFSVDGGMRSVKKVGHELNPIV